MSSLSDQLLKAGLVTADQVKKAAEKPPKAKKKFKKTTQGKSKNRSSETSDLAQFYKQRSSLETKEKNETARKKQLAAKLKKETNGKINKLISENLLNNDTAEIRYNFVVGTTIKYVFVNEQQQQYLADGEIAITFLGGKRALIPASIAKEITQLNPDKIVIFSC